MILQSLCRIFDLKHWRAWLPSRGNVLFTLMVAASLLSYAQSAGAFPSRTTTAASTSVIPYQGRLTNTSGAALAGSYNMTFKLYGVVSGGSALWSEAWSSGNAVAVSNGLFNVLLGSLTPLPQSVIANNSSLWLGITVGADSEMAPRIQLGSAPFAMQALSVPTGAITTTMLADGAITSAKLAVADAYSYVPTQESTTSTTPVSLTTPDTITLSLPRTQWVYILYVATAAATTGKPAFIWVSLDGADIGDSVIEMWGSSTTTISGIYRAQLSAGMHTISLKYSTQTGATATYWRRQLLALVLGQ